MSSSVDDYRVCGIEALPASRRLEVEVADADVPGFCYLTIVKPEFSVGVKNRLGSWPHVQELLRLPLAKFDVSKVIFARVIRHGSLWHFVEAGGESLQDVFREVVRNDTESYVVGTLGASSQATLNMFHPADFRVGRCERLGGVLGSLCPELLQLREKEFDQCRCAIHSVPVTKPDSSVVASAGIVHGCVQKPVGKAGVLRNAFVGKPGMCHAESDTREADKRFLAYVVTDVDPGLLDGKSRDPGFARLCTSSLDADLADFGNGYCYLSLFHRDTWWRAARLLGPNPLIRSVYRVHLWAGKPASKKHQLLCVGDGFFHVLVDKGTKGIVQTAGRDIASVMSSVLFEFPDAKVGGDPSCVVKGFDCPPAVSQDATCVDHSSLSLPDDVVGLDGAEGRFSNAVLIGHGRPSSVVARATVVAAMARSGGFRGPRDQVKEFDVIVDKPLSAAVVWAVAVSGVGEEVVRLGLVSEDRCFEGPTVWIASKADRIAFHVSLANTSVLPFSVIAFVPDVTGIDVPSLGDVRVHAMDEGILIPGDVGF